jgi:hypothetical protein
LNVHRVSDVRQIQIHTAELLVPDPSPFEVQIATAKIKEYKWPGSDQIPAELIRAGGETIEAEIHKLINSVWNKEELPDQWKESTVVPIYQEGDKADCRNYRGISLLPTSHRVLYNILPSKFGSYVNRNYWISLLPTSHIILSNIILSKVGSYVDEIIGYHSCQLHT